ncbi:zf-HC2 domain-containing protein [Kitasatospora azatica]|uniref:zf-HC2 domain-containing protein n=1 Tax=Kitasatospora azatica TaxID=58347 RepID=UPI00055ADB9D|nr:zf-HC2 domain-containing protein [Kitasatospora azatica]
MNTEQHQQSAGLLGAYVLGALEAADLASVERHLLDCPPCRQEVAELQDLERALGEVPPELLVDGPPEGGDLLLQRTLRQARSERGTQHRRRWALVGVAAVVAAAAVLTGGVLLGRATTPATPPVAVGPAPSVSVTPPPAGTRTASATDQSTGARMTLTVTPAAGWVRVSAAVTGVPAGQRCRLVVNGKDGTATDAGSWLVSPAGAKSGTSLDGSALVAPAEVSSVSVVNDAGQTFVTVPL